MNIKIFKKFLQEQSKKHSLTEAKSVTIVFLARGGDNYHAYIDGKGRKIPHEHTIVVTSKKDLADQLGLKESEVFAPWRKPKSAFRKLQATPDGDITLGKAYNPIGERADDYEGIFTRALANGETLYAFPDFAPLSISDSLALYGTKATPVWGKYPASTPGLHAIGLQKDPKSAAKLAEKSREALVYYNEPEKPFVSRTSNMFD